MKELKILRISSQTLLFMSMGKDVPVPPEDLFTLKIKSVEIPTVEFIQKNVHYVNPCNDRYWTCSPVKPFDHNGFDEESAKRAVKCILRNGDVKDMKVTNSAGYRPILKCEAFEDDTFNPGDVFALYKDFPILFIDETTFIAGTTMGYGQFMDELTEMNPSESRVKRVMESWFNSLESFF